MRTWNLQTFSWPPFLAPGTGGQERRRSIYPSRVDCNRQAQTIQFDDQGLDRAGSTDSSPQDSIGSNGVGWVLWAEMARYRVSNARSMPQLPICYTQARKTAVSTCASQKMPFTHHSQHLSHLQSIVDRPINTMLSLRKMGE
ncbi:hypothetical protein TNCV_2516921 [Trichonephila clavipes]|nr:hypothetical protein TNCV_2516921 [Trichonephila clavipes]